eukprot:CAMPEP_0184499226 /NCGR_PEP_ID=MMETSP0113_2-20130426/40931_1 /TAXON_ID=91329 /ORGANISM="Norrisiella sphaerica, Strain BC52" /LENGTH=753 /DNA_ID=CAMNT_0026887061 /DNA_START=47 /DNA_END=2308 /DNA_ORIENTATION=+
MAAVPRSATIVYGKALYDFTPPKGGKSQKISFSKGDILQITFSEQGEGWWWGKVSKTRTGGPPSPEQGYFPAKYVKIIQLDDIFSENEKVCITGLEDKFPRFNGQIGFIKDFENGLWAIRLPGLDDCVVRVRPTNLKKYNEGSEGGDGNMEGKADHEPETETPKALSFTSTTIESKANHGASESKVAAVQNISSITPSVAHEFESKLISLENENRALRLKLKQMEVVSSDTLPHHVTDDAMQGLLIDPGSGWEQEMCDELCKFFRRIQVRNDTHELISKHFLSGTREFRLDLDSKKIASLLDKDKIGDDMHFDTSLLKTKEEELREHLDKKSSGLSVEQMRQWVKKHRGNITGCCKELWQTLMDQIIQADAESMDKLLVSAGIVEEDQEVARIFQEAIIKPLKPLFNSDTEEKLETESNMVQECLRKTKTYENEAAAERLKKSAKSFIAAKKLDLEAQTERLKLLKRVEKYKDIIAASIEYRIENDIAVRADRYVEEIKKLTEFFGTKKTRCAEDLKVIERELSSLEESDKKMEDKNQKYIAAFETFLDQDNEERAANLRQIQEILNREKSRQVRYVDSCLSELVRRHEDAMHREAAKELASGARAHASLLNKRLEYLEKGERFTNCANQLLNTFSTEALKIMRTQRQHIDTKKGMLEELYSNELSDLNTSLDTQENKLRENISKIKIRMKKKEKELSEAVEAEDVDDIEECEAALANYKARQDKMTAELEEVLKMKQNVEGGDFKVSSSYQL